MAIAIKQEPKYNLVPAGSDIIYTVYDDANIAGNFKIKYIAEVYVKHNTTNITSTANRVAVLKASPNATGRGIFNLRSILENYVSPDYEGGVIHTQTNSFFSQYNGVSYSDSAPHTIHQIDDFSTNRNSVRYVRVKFKIEYSTTATGQVSIDTGNEQLGAKFLIYNGVLNDTDILNFDNDGFGFNLGYEQVINNSSGDKFLTNAPKTQYIRTNDYMTIPFFSQYNDDFTVGSGSATQPAVKKIEIQFYYNGSTTGSLITKTVSPTNGGHFGYLTESAVKLQFAGIGTGNLVGAGETVPTNWDYYTVRAKDDADQNISDIYYIYKQEDDCKGFETIRLCWLNKYGTWDYYNFTKKSTRSFSANRKRYKQIAGSWNKSVFRLRDHRGGHKHFDTNITEQITINTDYITEAESEWLEELFISTDVYMLNQRSTDSATQGYSRKYIEPVTLNTTSFTRRTKANDRLIQHTIVLDKTRTKRTQRI
tara:strand:+ start:11470 stop:12909 length:1440 start_codon:yes stop_codon:yes gene_type:complete